MPQPAKKDVIAQAALPLLLELGVKGTSIDRVVKACGVSKPTVYKYFPDKAALVHHAIKLWLGQQVKPNIKASSIDDLYDCLVGTWLAPEPLRIYALMLGESARVEQATQLFIECYDQPWRARLRRWGDEHELCAQQLDHQVSHWIFQCLTQAV